MALRSRFIVTALVLGLGFCASLGGCKLPASGSGEVVGIPMPPYDLNPDGTIKDQGLQRIEDKAKGGQPLAVGFSHGVLTDSGLVQLGQFKNLRRVEAPGSRITSAGIQRLKKLVPEVEVIQ